MSLNRFLSRVELEILLDNNITVVKFLLFHILSDPSAAQIFTVKIALFQTALNKIPQGTRTSPAHQFGSPWTENDLSNH